MQFCQCFIFLNPELRALVTKNKDTLERYEGLVQSNYKEPTNGNFDDCILKRFWPNYKQKKTVNRRKSASRKQDRNDFFKDI